MDPFSYLSVLISIILGLGITQLVTGLGRLIQARARIKFYAPTIAWVGLLLIIHVQTWWAMFGLRSQLQWSFIQFFVVLLQPLVLSLLAALVLPDIGPETVVDLRANYFAHSRWFFGLLVLLLLVSLTKDVVLSGSLPNGLNVGAHVVFIVTSLVAAFVNREWLHRLLAPLNVALMLAYIAVLFARLP